MTAADHLPAETGVQQPAVARIVAVDIGAGGALAFLEGGRLLGIVDMPTLKDGPAGRRAVNGYLLADIIRQWRPTEAVCEYVAARPGEAPTAAFSFGRSRGVVEGVLAAQGLPTRFLTPAAWKRRAGVPAGKENKDRARGLAIARWPEHASLFARKLDVDRAEAALLGLAYLQGSRP